MAVSERLRVIHTPESWALVEQWLHKHQPWEREPDRPADVETDCLFLPPSYQGGEARLWSPTGQIVRPDLWRDVRGAYGREPSYRDYEPFLHTIKGMIAGGARLFDDASSQYLENSTLPVTATPLTMASLFNKDDDAISCAVCSLNGTFSNRFQLIYDANEDVLAQVVGPTATGTATSSGAGAINAWTHGIAVFTSNTSRAAYRDGANVGTDATNSGTPTVSSGTINIGTRYNIGSRGIYFSGQIAEVGMWDAALSAENVLALGSNPLSPLLIRPQRLVFYCPLFGNTSPEIDIFERRNMTVTGATKSAHPRVFYPPTSLKSAVILKTRLYLPSTGNAAVSPAFDAGWEETADADRRAMVTTKIASAMTDKTITSLLSAGQALFRQYVSAPLNGAQHISSKIYGYARVLETLGSLNGLSQMVVKVVSNDGSTVRGTLLSIADYGGGTEWNTSARNKAFADGDLPSNVDAQDNDRVVAEIGLSHDALITTATIRFGDASSSDLPADETTTTDDNPWIEFQQALLFKAETAAGQSITPSGLAVSVAYGTQQLNLKVAPSGLAVSVAYGTAKLNQKITPSGLAVSVSYGTQKLNLKVAPSGLAVSVSYGSQIVAGPVIVGGLAIPISYGTAKLNLKVAPSGLAVSVAYGGNKLSLKVAPSGLVVSVGYGTHQLNERITPAGLAVGVSYGVHVVAGPVIVGGLAVAVSYGSHQLNLKVALSGLAVAVGYGSQKLNLKIQPSGLAVSIAYGTASVTNSQRITPSGLAVVVSYGSHVLAGPVVVSGLAVAVSYGSHRLNLKVAPSGLAVAVSYGTQKLNLKVAPSGLAVAVSHGSHFVELEVAPSGLAVTVSYGSHKLNLAVVSSGLAVSVSYGSQRLSLKVAPSGLAVAVSYGSHRLATKIAPSGLAVSVSFGSHKLNLKITLTGLAVTVVYGAPTIKYIQIVSPAGLAVMVAFGSQSLRIKIVVTGLAVLVAYGTHTVSRTINAILEGCVDLDELIDRNAWPDHVIPSGYNPELESSTPSGYIAPRPYIPAPSGYQKVTGGTNPWDM